MISVIIPLYNKERQIRATLESVLRQSYTDFEIVVVDDGSTDGSAAAVESVHDARMRLIRQENGGVSAARNRGIQEARGEYVAFLDADDLWEPDFLKTLHQLSVLYPDCSVYACNYDFVSPDGTHRSTIIRRLPFTGEHGVLNNYFEVASCSHPPLWTSALMVRKEAMQAIGGFPVGIKSGEDLLTWARLACSYKIAYTRRVTAHYTTIHEEDVEKAINRWDEQDPVLQGLLLLEQSYGDQIPALSTYIHRWKKIQCILAFRVGARAFARKYSLEALMDGASAREFIPLYILSFFPISIIEKILKYRSKH